MQQDQALIDQLCARFERKPRKCHKLNDSNIGYAERIVCISKDTFYYYPKIQQFQDLDFDKLQYVVPKAGVKLTDITQLKFPPRRKNQRNFFSITLPKNRILKFTKDLSEIIVDEKAEGEQEWTFLFDYDIVALPMKERKGREARKKEIEAEEKNRQQMMRQKEKEEKDKKDKINEEIDSLVQTEDMRSGGQTEEYLRNRRQLSEKEQTQRMIQQADELFFHYHYRRLLSMQGDKEVAEAELALLEQVGRFRKRAEEAVTEFVDELSFSPMKMKNGHYYRKNNLLLKFGDKGLNQQFIANYQVADAVLATREKIASWELRVPLKALIKYKGFKVMVCAVTPMDGLEGQAFDEAIVHGYSTDNWKIDFLLVEAMTYILDYLKLKPYFSEVHYQKVLIHFGSQLKILQTNQNPFSSTKRLEPSSFQEPEGYCVRYMYDIDQVFPIDLDLFHNSKQDNRRLRPEYIKLYIEKVKGDKEHEVTHLSAGALTYSFDDQEGEKEDLAVMKVSQRLNYQDLVLFVRKLDRLQYIINDSRHLSKVMKQHGINIRYLGRIIKISQLPYIRSMAQIDVVARIIRTLYRQFQHNFVQEVFRNGPNKQYIQQTYQPNVKPSMQRIKIKLLRQEEEKASKLNAIDFLNLVFGVGPEFEPFWQIIRDKVKAKYDFDMKDPQDYTHGYLLKTVLYHCGLDIQLHERIKLFMVQKPFTQDDKVRFITKSKVYDFPSMTIHQYADASQIPQDQPHRLLDRYQLQLQISEALNSYNTDILLQLSKLTKQVGPPSDKYTLQSFLYQLYHPTADNFETAYGISQMIFPPSHPRIMEMYLQYAKIEGLDPVTLKKAAQNHAIRNLGLSHWRTSEILSNFVESDYINNLLKAESGVQKSKKSQLYLKIIKELARYGKLYESLSYVSRAIQNFNSKESLAELTTQQRSNYFQILLTGIQVHYKTRTIEELLVLCETFYKALMFCEVPAESKWYEWLMFYTLKAFLESSKKKYYLFKLILIFRQKKKKPLDERERAKLKEEMWKKWQSALNHINHIKEVLLKLQFGYAEINGLKDFFTEFENHRKRHDNQDFNEGLKQYQDLYNIYGFAYFEDALTENVFAFEKRSDLSHYKAKKEK